jgi:DnaJ-class molecular chaperone
LKTNSVRCVKCNDECVTKDHVILQVNIPPEKDDDTRDRLRLLGYSWKRNEQGLFYALYHEDNKPNDSDQDFINNHILLQNLHKNLDLGFDHVTADVEEHISDGNIRWLKIKNFKYKII